MDDPKMLGLVSVLVLAVGLLAVIITMICYDIWIYRKYGSSATISRGAQRLGYATPLFAFLVGLLIGLVVGVLAGHFWWGMSIPG